MNQTKYNNLLYHTNHFLVCIKTLFLDIKIFLYKNHSINDGEHVSHATPEDLWLIGDMRALAQPNSVRVPVLVLRLSL